MSLEAAITALTAAVTENNELLKISNAGRDAAIEVAKGASVAKPAAAKAKADSPKAEPEQPKADDFAGDEGFGRMKAIVAGYLKVESKDEQQARAATLTKALGKLDATKLGEVAEKNRPTLVAWINTLAAGENVEELADEESTGSLLD